MSIPILTLPFKIKEIIKFRLECFINAIIEVGNINIDEIISRYNESASIEARQKWKIIIKIYII